MGIVVVVFGVAAMIYSQSTNRRRIAEWRQRTEGMDPDSPEVSRGPRLVGTRMNRRQSPAAVAVVLVFVVGGFVYSLMRSGGQRFESPTSLITLLPLAAGVYFGIKFLTSPRRWR